MLREGLATSAFFHSVFTRDWFILNQIQTLHVQRVTTNTGLSIMECSMERSVSQCGKASFGGWKQ